MHPTALSVLSTTPPHDVTSSVDLLVVCLAHWDVHSVRAEALPDSATDCAHSQCLALKQGDEL